MTDEKETATTMWQDHHSGKRGHQLMTEKLADTIPAIGANANVADCDAIIAPAKMFSPYSNWTWYITEMDLETGQCFGLVDGFERELGYFDLTELADTTVFGGVPAVERDLYWQPRTIGEIKSGSREGSPDSEDAREGETMTDEIGTANCSSDALGVEEFFFGPTADDAPAEVAGECPIEDATDDAAVIEGEDCQGEASGEPQEPDDAGDEAMPAEELKVVVSIKGGRATIGVQQPSADPHIESFDDPDLFGLADEFPAVVARARARWEEEPRHPAYVKPAAPARRQRRREQATAETSTAEGEAEQQQPETLRLF